MPSIFSKEVPTEIVFVVDRSGSMATIKDAMEEAIKSYLNQLQHANCYVTLYQFNEHNACVFSGQPIQDVNEIRILPSGSTALYDALGAVLYNVEKANEGRDHKVSIVVITDGQENASHTHTAADIKKRIERLQGKWQFTFLGSNQNAWNESEKLGIAYGQTMTFANNSAGVYASLNATAARTANYASKGVDVSYSAKDIEEQIKAGAKI